MSDVEELLAAAVPSEDFTAPMALLHERARARQRRRRRIIAGTVGAVVLASAAVVFATSDRDRDVTVINSGPPAPAPIDTAGLPGARRFCFAGPLEGHIDYTPAQTASAPSTRMIPGRMYGEIRHLPAATYIGGEWRNASAKVVGAFSSRSDASGRLYMGTATSSASTPSFIDAAAEPTELVLEAGPTDATATEIPTRGHPCAIPVTAVPTTGTTAAPASSTTTARPTSTTVPTSQTTASATTTATAVEPVEQQGSDCESASLRAAVRRFFEAFNAGDMATVDRMVSAEGRFQWASLPKPYGTDLATYSRREALDSFKAAHDGGVRVDVDTLAFDGDQHSPATGALIRYGQTGSIKLHDIECGSRTISAIAWLRY